MVYFGEIRQSFIAVWFCQHRNHSINILAKDSNDPISLLRWNFCHSSLQEQTINLFDPLGFQNWQAESLITVVAYSRYQSSSQGLGSPSSLDHVSARGVLQTGKDREVPLYFCSTEELCRIGQGSRKIWTQIFAFFSVWLKNLLNDTKLSLALLSVYETGTSNAGYYASWEVSVWYTASRYRRYLHSRNYNLGS